MYWVELTRLGDAIPGRKGPGCPRPQSRVPRLWATFNRIIAEHSDTTSGIPWINLPNVHHVKVAQSIHATVVDQVKYSSKLEGCRILIVGGSAGVGYALAEACIEQGAGAIIISSSNNNRVQDAVARLRRCYHSKASRISGFPCNLAQEDVLGENITALLNAATSNSSYKVDHIAYTAGDTLILRTLWDVDLYYLKSLFLLRSFAAVLLTKLAAKHIASSRSSSITFTCGASDIRPLPGRPVLAMLTGSFRGLIRGLAISLKPVRVNAVSLGAVNTSALQSTWSDKSPEEEHEILGLLPFSTS